MTSASREPKSSLVGRFYRAIEVCDWNEFDRTCAPDMLVWHNVDKIAKPISTYGRTFQRLRESCEVWKYDIHRISETDFGCVCEVTLNGLSDIGAYSVDVCAIFYTDGKNINRINEYYDPKYTKFLFGT